jgi:hypothetical protein
MTENQIGSEQLTVRCNFARERRPGLRCAGRAFATVSPIIYRQRHENADNDQNGFDQKSWQPAPQTSHALEREAFSGFEHNSSLIFHRGTARNETPSVVVQHLISVFVAVVVAGPGLENPGLE